MENEITITLAEAALTMEALAALIENLKLFIGRDDVTEEDLEDADRVKQKIVELSTSIRKQTRGLMVPMQEVH
tara:strand:- start:25807 stop:26025 length:219 start_codon:yes stop_codon:yes gene_type:complete